MYKVYNVFHIHPQKKIKKIDFQKKQLLLQKNNKKNKGGGVCNLCNYCIIILLLFIIIYYYFIFHRLTPFFDFYKMYNSFCKNVQSLCTKKSPHMAGLNCGCLAGESYLTL